MKLNPLPENIRGKRLVVVDDSIVRGTTTRQVVAMLREAGAAEVHFRVSSPPYRWPCFYGMDTGRRGELLAADLSVGEIREYLGVDSIAYLDLDRLHARHARAGHVVLHGVPLERVPGAGASSPRRDAKLVLEPRSSTSRPSEPELRRRAHLRRRRRRHRRRRAARST